MIGILGIIIIGVIIAIIFSILNEK